MVDKETHWDNVYQGQNIQAPYLEAPYLDHPVFIAALEHFGGSVSNRRLLDLGCGLGTASLFFAEHGASVTSVDTSAAAISTLRAYCIEHGISNIEPILMPAANITDIGPFDFIFGSMILHHIEPFTELASGLRAGLLPEGKAFFYENSATSSLLMWFRNHVIGKLGVPKYGDEEESPLSGSEIKTLADHFHVEIIYPEFVFFRLIPIYLLGGRWQRPFRQLDDLLYAVPYLRQYSYRQYILLS